MAPTTPPPPARSPRRWLVYGCGGIVALLVACVVFGALVNRMNGQLAAAPAPTPLSQAERIQAAAATPQPLDASTPTPQPTEPPTPIPPTDAPTVAPTATPPPPTATPAPAIGQDVKVGDVRWKVLEAKDVGDTLKSDNSFIKPKTTAGKWVMLRFEIENQGTEQRNLTGVDLKDAQGRTFKASTDALFFIPQEEQCSFAQLSANVPRTCWMYFEVPKDASGLRAVVGDLKLFGAKDQEIALGF